MRIMRSGTICNAGMASRSATSGPWRRKEVRALYRCFVQVDEATYHRLLASQLPAPLQPYGDAPDRNRHDNKHVKTSTVARAGVFQVEWDRQKRPCLIVVQNRQDPHPGMNSVQGRTLEAMLMTLDAICRQWIHDCSQDDQVLHDSLITYQMSLGAWRRSRSFTLKAQLPTALYLWALDALAPPPLSEPDLSPDQKAERESLYEGRRRKDLMWNLALGPDLSNALARPIIAQGGGGSGSDSGGGSNNSSSGGGGGGSGGGASSGCYDANRAVAALTDALAGASLSASPAARPSANQRWFRLPDALQFTGGNVQAGRKCGVPPCTGGGAEGEGGARAAPRSSIPPCTLMGSTVSPTVCLLHPLAKGASPSPEDELWTAAEAHQLMEAIEKLIMAGGWPLGFTTPSAHTQMYPQGGQACGRRGQARGGRNGRGTGGGVGEVGFNFQMVPCLE